MQKVLQDFSIGKNIRRIREKNGMKQIKLVTEMQVRGSKVTDTTLSKIEGGYRNIRVSDLVILQEIFNVSYNEFFKDLSVEFIQNMQDNF